MQEHTTIPFPHPQLTAEDPLTAVLRQGAQRLLAQAIEVEVTILLTQYAHRHDAEGRQAIVRNGYLPEREVQTGIGAVRVKVPRVRDRSGAGIRFHSALLPPYIRRSKSLEAFLPWLYLKGVSTGDFSEALQALLGPDAPGLSPATLSRLKQGWQEELAQWQQRDLTGKRYVYVWVDGVYLETRLEESRHCILVIIGADASGQKELVGLWDGYRESEQSWKDLLLDLQSRGLTQGPALAIGDGALGFWKALRQVYGQTRGQRCWVHKTANVLDKLPKDLQPQAKQRLQAIWMAPNRQRAALAFDLFIATYEAKYPKAAECLAQDREELLVFYDFPAEHWGHIRTTNPIESTFATVRLRTDKTRRGLSRVTMLAMVFKLYQSAAKRWHRLRAAPYLPEVMQGMAFKDGLRVEQDAA
jgi:transposase-like protein